MDYYFQFVLNCCQWASFTVVPGPFIMSPYFLVFPYFPRTLDPFIVESYLEMEICILVVSPANRFYYFLEAKKARRYTLHNTHTHTHTHTHTFILRRPVPVQILNDSFFTILIPFASPLCSENPGS